jgi:hypothetical protein
MSADTWENPGRRRRRNSCWLHAEDEAAEHCEGPQRQFRSGEVTAWGRQRQPPQQTQGAESAHQVSRHDQRLQQQGDGERTQEPLQTNHQKQQRDGKQWLSAVLTAYQCPDEERGDDGDQRARDVTMDHFVPGLTRLAAAVGYQMAIAARPIGAAEPRVRQSDPSAEHDHEKREDGAEQRHFSETLNPHWTVPRGASGPRACPWAWRPVHRTS